MNILKGFKDMADMLVAAPDLIESANAMGAEAKLMQQNQAAVSAPVVIQPPAASLVPIAGVDLDLYVRISKGIAAYNYDAAMLPTVATSFGISQADWTIASAGWATRIQTDGSVGARFNQLYLAA
jgi:hypothetical protein